MLDSVVSKRDLSIHDPDRPVFVQSSIRKPVLSCPFYKSTETAVSVVLYPWSGILCKMVVLGSVAVHIADDEDTCT